MYNLLWYTSSQLFHRTEDVVFCLWYFFQRFDLRSHPFPRIMSMLIYDAIPNLLGQTFFSFFQKLKNVYWVTKHNRSEMVAVLGPNEVLPHYIHTLGHRKPFWVKPKLSLCLRYYALCHEGIWEVEVCLHHSGCRTRWSASRPERFNPREIVPVPIG
jgi:hypothetical protein